MWLADISRRYLLKFEMRLADNLIFVASLHEITFFATDSLRLTEAGAALPVGAYPLAGRTKSKLIPESICL